MSPNQRLPLRSKRVILLVLLLIAAGAGVWRYAAPDADGPPSLPAASAAVPVSVTTVIATAAEPPPGAARRSVEPTLAEVVRKAFRASPPQRAADRQRMQDANDYSVLAEEFLGRAKAGDADAAQALADLLNRCAAAYFYSGPDQSADLQSIALHAGLDDQAVRGYQAAFVAEQRRCERIGQANGKALSAAAAAMNRLAGELGEPGALLARLLTLPGGDPALADQRRRLAAQTFEEGGSDALARHAVMLSVLSGLRQEAFALAACWLNPTCAEDPTTYAVQHDPVGQLAMTTGNYMVLRTQSPRDQLITETQARDILRLWHARRFEDLLVPISPLPPTTP